MEKNISSPCMLTTSISTTHVTEEHILQAFWTQTLHIHLKSCEDILCYALFYDICLYKRKNMFLLTVLFEE